MKFKFLFLSICSFIALGLTAQIAIQPDGGGSYDMYANMKDEMSSQQRADIIKMLKTNEALLRKEGLLPSINQPLVTGFQWPLGQSGGECILNLSQTISSGGKITFISGKSFRILGDLKIL